MSDEPQRTTGATPEGAEQSGGHPLERVRARAAMWVGNTRAFGLHRLFLGIVDNSIEEAVAGRAREVDVRLHADGSLSVTDDGPGISVDVDPRRGIPTLTAAFTCPHWERRPEERRVTLASGPGDPELPVINALSGWLEVTVRRDQEVWFQRFERGIAVTELECAGAAAAGETGTCVRWLADPEIFPGVRFAGRWVRNRLRTLSYLVAGMRLTFTDEQTGTTERYESTGGLADFVELLNTGRETWHSPITVHRDGPARIDAAIQYHDGPWPQILSFANHTATPDGGAHELGLVGALRDVLNGQPRPRNGPGAAEDLLTDKDVRAGLCAVISVRLPDPVFEGSTRGRLGNHDLEAKVRAAVSTALQVFLDEHPDAQDGLMGFGRMSQLDRRYSRDP